MQANNDLVRSFQYRSIEAGNVDEEVQTRTL